MNIMLACCIVLSICAQEIPQWDLAQEVKSYQEKNSPDDFEIGHYPLHLACAQGRLDMVQYLIEKEQQDINQEIVIRSNWKYKHFNTPLIQAIRSNHVDIVEYLVDRGVSVNRKANAASPLYYACANPDTKILKLLLQKKADINDEPFQPIYHAIKQNNSAAVKILLDHKAHIDYSIYMDGVSPAVARALLLYGVSVDLNEKQSAATFSKLHATIATDFIILPHEVINDNKHLIQERDAEGNTPLFYAATQTDVEIVNILLEEKSALLTRNYDNKDVFYYIRRILKRDDLDTEKKDRYQKIFDDLHRYSWAIYQVTSRLPFPREIRAYIKSYC